MSTPKSALHVGDLDTYLLRGSLDPHEPAPKQHLDQFSYLLHSSAVCQTHTHTDHTMCKSIATGCIYALHTGVQRMSKNVQIDRQQSTITYCKYGIKSRLRFPLFQQWLSRFQYWCILTASSHQCLNYSCCCWCIHHSSIHKNL